MTAAAEPLMGAAVSMGERIGVGGLWITVGTPARTARTSRREQATGSHRQPAPEPVAPSLVWRSVRSGAVLSRGRAMTQQQAIHTILTHSRNEIIASRTTPTRITYRTPNTRAGGPDSITVYEGTHSDQTASIPAQPQGAARPAAISEASATAPAAPTVIAAQPETPPVTPGMQYRVWHQPLDNIDHASESFDDQFFIQTATLAEAVQLERVLAAYDTWADRNGEHDIEVWDGTAWSEVDPAAQAAADVFLRRIYDLDDITAATAARGGDADADPT